MRIICDINPGSFDKIEKYLAGGRYRTVAEFLSIAVENQIFLEESGEAVMPSTPIVAAQTVISGEGERGLDSLTPPAKVPAVPSYPRSPLLVAPPRSVRAVPPPPLERLRFPFVWGQFNRVFPAVVILRVLANLLQARGSQFIPLQTLYMEAGSHATTLGRFLRQMDQERRNPRGNKLATALPVADRDQVKSLTRFRSQFVGHLEKKGNRLYGLCPSLRMVDIVPDPKEGYLAGITQFGLQFAALPNPVLDDMKFGTVLGPEEVSFYLNHIRTQLPQEYAATKGVVKAVKEGYSSPSSLDTIVQQANPDWGPEVAATQRAGLLSRLTELGLLEIVWSGSSSTYRVTDSGEALIRGLQTESDVEKPGSRSKKDTEHEKVSK